MSGLHQLKASAGSGKTYALTERLLALLGGAEQESAHLACAPGPATSYAWPEILAATFTNKAAAEMKERVVAAIKRTALDIPDGQRADWPARRAEAMLERMLRRYHQLNIRTIDSLLHMLLKVFALDADLPPDFELEFDMSPTLDAALDRMVAECEHGDHRLAARFHDALAAILEFERSGNKPITGLWIADRLRTRLAELAELLMGSASEVETDQQRLAGLLVPAFEAYRSAAESLRRCLEGCGAEPLANFSKFMNGCVPNELFDGITVSLTYAQKHALAECVKKGSRPVVGPAQESCYREFKLTLARYRQAHAVLQPAYAMAPSVELALRALELVRQEERSTGRVLSQTMPARVRELLAGDWGVPDAFCRLGSRLSHLLMDEFQDTSRDQWAALAPLAEECLAKGGSLFYVGDVKQAIYGWRGGDATLFDEIAALPDLAAMAEDIRADSLPENWRSSRKVVDFNNDLFSRLGSPDTASLLADTVLGQGPDSCRRQFAESVQAVYADPVQRLPESRSAEGGYVRLQRLPGGLAGEVMEQTVAATGDLVEELLARRAASDVCLLVRTGTHAEALCDELVGRGVPVVTESSLKLKRHPAVRQLAALLAVSDFPADETALAEVVLGDLFLTASGLERDDLHAWLATRERGPLHLALRDRFPEAWKRALAPFVSRAGLMTPYDLASDAARILRAEEVFPGSTLFVRRFLELVHRAGEQGYATLADFLEFWKDRGDEEKVSLPESMDAVRILTMHKAKGLQFPVAVVPFTHWSLRGETSPVVAEVEGRRVVTRMTSAMGEPYYHAKAVEALEQLNLLYVAFTRAEEELYAFLPGEVHGTFGPAMAALDLLHTLDEEQPLLVRGEPARSAPAAPGAPPSPSRPGHADAGLMAWLPRLRVYRHMEETADFALLRGETAHRAMELLHPAPGQTIRPQDARRARVQAMDDFPALAALPAEQRALLANDLEAMLAWVMGHPELPGLLASGRAELPMLDEEGNLRRADFVHLGERENVVLEFKTGRADPAHVRQVGDYLAILRAALPEQPARGLVVYLDLKRVDQVGG